MTNWDDEIDDAARQMTAGEPRADFRARVLTRIGAIDSARRPGWSRWTWSPIAAGAVALVVVVILLAPWKAAKRDSVGMTANGKVEAPPVAGREGSGGRGKAGSASGGSNDPASDGLRSLTEIRPTRVSDEGRRARRVAAGRAPDRIALGGASIPIDGLDSLAPEPIEIEPIGVESMEAMETIPVPRLAVAQLDVPAIGGE